MSGIPDPSLLSRLKTLFGHLLFHQTKEVRVSKTSRTLQLAYTYCSCFQSLQCMLHCMACTRDSQMVVSASGVVLPGQGGALTCHIH